MQNGGDLQTAGTGMKSRPGILKNTQPLCPTPQDPWERARGEEATHSLQRHPWERARAARGPPVPWKRTPPVKKAPAEEGWWRDPSNAEKEGAYMGPVNNKEKPSGRCCL